MKGPRLILIVLLIGCSDKKEEYTSQRTDVEQMPLQDYLISEFKQDSTHREWRISSDTLTINSLNITLYRAHSMGLDDDEYVLIKDNHSDAIFKLVIPGWHPYGLSLISQDLQLQILENQQPIETINFQFLGLEAFLNQSTALKDNRLSMDALDSIFMYWKPMLRRVETDEDIMRIFEPTDSLDSKEWSQKVTSILKRRFQCEYVLMYKLDKAYIYYFEVNPFENCWSLDYYDASYEQLIKGNLYNLRAMIVEGSR